jgi:hypothetical protein
MYVESPRSRTGLLNAAASRLVEWCGSTTLKTSEENKDLTTRPRTDVTDAQPDSMVSAVLRWL